MTKIKNFKSWNESVANDYWRSLGTKDIKHLFKIHDTQYYSHFKSDEIFLFNIFSKSTLLFSKIEWVKNQPRVAENTNYIADSISMIPWSVLKDSKVRFKGGKTIGRMLECVEGTDNVRVYWERPDKELRGSFCSILDLEIIK